MNALSSFRFALLTGALLLGSAAAAQPVSPASIRHHDAATAGSLSIARGDRFALPSSLWGQLITIAEMRQAYDRFDWSNPGLSDGQRHAWCHYAPEDKYRSWATACLNGNKRRAKRIVRRYFGLPI